MKVETVYLLLRHSGLIFLLQEEFSTNFDSYGGDTVRHQWTLPYIRVAMDSVGNNRYLSNFKEVFSYTELLSTMARTTLGISVAGLSLRYLDTDKCLSCYVASSWEKNFPSPLSGGRGYFSKDGALSMNLNDSNRSVLEGIKL